MYVKINELVNILSNDDEQLNKIEVYVNCNNVFKNTYGLSVEPIHIIKHSSNGRKVYSYTDIINLFDNRVKIDIKETEHRRITNPNFKIVINGTKRSYNNYNFYDYKFVPIIYKNEEELLRTLTKSFYELRELNKNISQGTEINSAYGKNE